MLGHLEDFFYYFFWKGRECCWLSTEAMSLGGLLDKEEGNYFQIILLGNDDPTFLRFSYQIKKI